MTQLVLPYPVSANRYWRSFVPKPKPDQHPRAFVFVSDEAKAYKRQVGLIARIAGVTKPSESLMELHLTLCPRQNKGGEASAVVLDLGNCMKVAEDALQGIVYVNDKQVKRTVLEYGDACQDGALIVEFMEFTAPVPSPVIRKPKQRAELPAQPF